MFQTFDRHAVNQMIAQAEDLGVTNRLGQPGQLTFEMRPSRVELLDELFGGQRAPETGDQQQKALPISNHKARMIQLFHHVSPAQRRNLKSKFVFLSPNAFRFSTDEIIERDDERFDVPRRFVMAQRHFRSVRLLKENVRSERNEREKNRFLTKIRVVPFKPECVRIIAARMRATVAG